MYETTYYEVNTLRSTQTSRTLSGDHENRVTDTGGVLVVKLDERQDYGMDCYRTLPRGDREGD